MKEKTNCIIVVCIKDINLEGEGQVCVRDGRYIKLTYCKIMECSLLISVCSNTLF